MESTPTTPARRALAARAAGPDAGPTTAQLMAAEESRRLAVESEAQMAELLSQEADRGDELEANVARSDKAAARWERKYSALKEGVDTLVDTVKLEREDALRERTVLNALIEEHAALKRELKAVKDDAELNLRESVRLQHELSAALEAGHNDRARTATARDCGALSGADEDEREEEEENDDGEYEDAEGDGGDESDGSAEQIRDELLAFAAGRSSTGICAPIGLCASVAGDSPSRLADSAFVAKTVAEAQQAQAARAASMPVGGAGGSAARRHAPPASTRVAPRAQWPALQTTHLPPTPPSDTSVAASDLRSGFTVVGSDANERSTAFDDGDDEGTLEDASIFVPPPVAGTPTKSAATDRRAPGASDPRSPLNMDFLARRAESQRALDGSADYATGLIEAGAVADGAGVAERSALGLQPLPPGEALWASPSGRWEPCTALLQVSEDPIMHLVRRSAGGAHGAVHLLLPEWAVRPFAAQEINVQHPFRERPLHVPWAPSHFHHCDAHGDGAARWLPVWVPPPSHPMHKALWSGAGLGADGVSAGHLGMVSSDLRCSVVQASRLLTVEEGAARGISLNEVAASTVGRRVMARSTSVLLEVHEAASPGPPDDDGSKEGGSIGRWSDASERESALGTAFGQHSHVGHHTQGVNTATFRRSAEPSFQRNPPPSSVAVGAGLSAVAPTSARSNATRDCATT